MATKIKSTNQYEEIDPRHPVIEALYQLYGAELTTDLKGNPIEGNDKPIIKTVALYKEYPTNGTTLYLIAWSGGLLAFNAQLRAFQPLFRVNLDYVAAEVVLFGKPDSLEELIAVFPAIRSIL